MITPEFLTMYLYYITTDYIVQLLIATIFPLLVLGLGIKFMRNLK